MEHGYPVDGHTRSMSCTWDSQKRQSLEIHSAKLCVRNTTNACANLKKALVSTIYPVSSGPISLSPTRLSSDPNPTEECPIELTIPLPHSSAGSESDYEDGESDTKESHNTLATERDPDGLIQGHNTHEDGAFSKDPAVPLPPNARPISLEELGSVARVERNYIYRVSVLRKRLDRLHYECGVRRRLSRVAEQAYRSMARSFATGDQGSFVGTYDAVQFLLGTLGILGQHKDLRALEEHTIDNNDGSLPPSSWIETLPAVHRENIRRFLTRIRTRPSCLAEQILKLPPAELTALTSLYRPNEVSSVLPGQNNPKSRVHGKGLGTVSRSSTSFDPKDLGQHDPIFLLLYGVWDDSSGFGSAEHARRTEVWATACARLIEVGHRASDDFISAALNVFTHLKMWALKPKLEAYLEKILNKGSFLSDQAGQPAVTFEEPIESYHAKAVVVSSEFFEKSIMELLELIVEDVAQPSPFPLRNLIQSILGKLGNGKLRDKAETFILSKWFFGSYISGVLTSPEASLSIAVMFL